MAEFFSPGPGERLRAARLSMGFDLAKIASELHLTQSVVERLEADEYDGIGARVFVRGYLRNYARIVGMPVESILRQFDDKWPEDPGGTSMLRESPRLPSDGGPSRGLAGAVSWLVVVGLIALFLMWWRGYLDGLVPEQIRSSAVEEPQPPIGLSAPAADGAIVDEPLPATMSADGSLRLPSVLGDPSAVEGTDSAAGLRETPPGLPDAAAVSGSLTTVDPMAVSGTLPETPEVVDPGVAGVSTLMESSAPAAGERRRVTGTADDPGPGAGAPVVDGTTGIVMTFSGPCWVDVRDSTRKFKLFGEMTKGTRKVLGGEPPYKLVIGNSRVVTIEVNGKPFDITPYAKGNVARFTLNP